MDTFAGDSGIFKKNLGGSRRGLETWHLRPEWIHSEFVFDPSGFDLIKNIIC